MDNFKINLKLAILFYKFNKKLFKNRSETEINVICFLVLKFKCVNISETLDAQF